MASLIYTSCPHDEKRGLIVYDADVFHFILVTNLYVPNAATHLKRSDITNEVVGTNYVAGGNVATAVLTKDTTNRRIDVTWSVSTWASANIMARAGVLCKWRGGAASADELIAYVDFGSDITSVGTNFVVTFTAPYRTQLP